MAWEPAALPLYWTWITPPADSEKVSPAFPTAAVTWARVQDNLIESYWARVIGMAGHGALSTLAIAITTSTRMLRHLTETILSTTFSLNYRSASPFYTHRQVVWESRKWFSRRSLTASLEISLEQSMGWVLRTPFWLNSLSDWRENWCASALLKLEWRCHRARKRQTLLVDNLARAVPVRDSNEQLMHEHYSSPSIGLIKVCVVSILWKHIHNTPMSSTVAFSFPPLSRP